MKKVVIVKCSMISNLNLCPGCAKCLVGFNYKEGEFERYGKEGAELLGIVDCGGCEGNANRVLLTLSLLKLQLDALGEKPDVIHIGTCIMRFCKKKDDLIKAIKDKVKIEVVEGTHPYPLPEFK